MNVRLFLHSTHEELVRKTIIYSKSKITKFLGINLMKDV